MSERVKVINPTKCNHGIKINQGAREMNVKPGQVFYLSMEDIEYIDSISTTFKRGFLKIVEDSVKDKDWLETIMFGVEINGISEDDIKNKLKSDKESFDNYIDEIKNRNDLNEKRQVFKAAKNMDLNFQK